MLRLTYEELFSAGGVLDEASTLTYDKLFRRSDPKRIWRSGHVRGPPMEMDAYKDATYYSFNFKSYPSTTGLRHRGYIKFEKPRHGRPMPAEQLPVVIDCTCPDYRYRWAWANKQRGASKVGSQSLNQAHDRAPRITNPTNKVGLCKHLLAAKNYIYGVIEKFDKQLPASKAGKGRTTKDVAWKLDQLVKYASKRWSNYSAEREKALQKQAQYRKVQQARNIAGPMPAADVPPNIDNEEPVPLPADLDLEVDNEPIDQTGNENDENENRNESLVVNTTADTTSFMNKDLLNRTKALVEAIKDDNEEFAPEGADKDGADFGGDAQGSGIPSPNDDELAEIAGVGAGVDVDPGDFGGGGGDEFSADLDAAPGGEGAPEDEALGLLRDIAAGIARLADKVAPSEAPEDFGGEDSGAGEFGGEDEVEPTADSDEGVQGEEGEDEPGVPPVEDDDDEFEDSMPVASGA